MCVKEYDVSLKWQGFLIPLFKHSKTIAEYEAREWQGKVLYYSEDMVLEISSTRLSDRVLLVHGDNTVCSWIDALKVLEKLKAVECQLQSLLFVIKDSEVKDEILQQIEFSMMLNHFQYPVIGVLQQDFVFEPQAWPSRDQLLSLLPSVKWEYTMGLPSEWQIPHDKYDLPTLSICIRATEQSALARAEIEWHGKEFYVGQMQGGKKHGAGISMKRNGSKFVGSFVSGMAHGEGVFYTRDGTIFAGEWKYGKQEGKGTIWSLETMKAAKRIQSNFRVHYYKKHLREMLK